MIAKSAVLAGLLFTGLSFNPIPTATVSSPSLGDAAFLRATHQADLTEIAGGNIAQTRGATARVRALGAQFVRDHTAIEGRLTAVARAAGVTLPDTPTAAQLALIKKYQVVKAFDGFYLRTQLEAHNEALAAGKAELANGADPEVKGLVRFAGPLVKAHHEALVGALSYGGHAR